MKQFEPPGIEKLSDDLLKLLESKGYGIGTVDNYRRVLSRVSIFMKKFGFVEYTERVGEAFRAEYSGFSAQWQRQIATIVKRLNELSCGAEFRLTQCAPGASVPAQFAEPLEAFLKSCAGSGNKENTVAGKRRFCGEFLCRLSEAGCNDIYDLSAAPICQAILKLENKDSYAVIRSFLRHLFEAGAVSRDYSGIIPKYRRHEVLPTIYTDDEISRVEDVIDRTTKTGKRDYAIFLLASRLGLRSGDIAALAFGNIDFSLSRISLEQSKTGRPLSLPLLPEISESLADYIDNARPNTEDEHIFIRANAPFERITTSLIRNSLTGYFKAANVDISGKKHGPHTLRSSMATSMVNSNIPYEAVRKALGHTDPQAIKHYAKVDIENLRMYAIDVPAPSGVFSMVLEGRERI